LSAEKGEGIRKRVWSGSWEYLGIDWMKLVSCFGREGRLFISILYEWINVLVKEVRSGKRCERSVRKPGA
jgi:hypothetical protein